MTGRTTGTPSTKRLLFGIAALAVVFATVAAGVFAYNAGQENGSSTSTGAQGEFPAFVYTTDETLAGYEAAVANPELFAKIPCYCGCGYLPDDPHQSVSDCFLKSDGTFDSHASGCQICVRIALDAVEWQEQDLSAAAIRAKVDSKYSQFGPATDTPPVTD